MKKREGKRKREKGRGKERKKRKRKRKKRKRGKGGKEGKQDENGSRRKRKRKRREYGKIVNEKKRKLRRKCNENEIFLQIIHKFLRYTKRKKPKQTKHKNELTNKVRKMWLVENCHEIMRKELKSFKYLIEICYHNDTEFDIFLHYIWTEEFIKANGNLKIVE